MNKFSIILFLSFLGFLQSCAKTEQVVAEFVSDCTGKYVRTLNVDYKVCNEDFIPDSLIGQQMTVKYRVKYDCLDSVARCKMYHPFANTVRIKKILPLE